MGKILFSFCLQTIDPGWEDIISDNEEDMKAGPWYKFTDLITGSHGPAPHNAEFLHARRNLGMVVGLYNKDTRSKKARRITLLEHNSVEREWVNKRQMDEEFPINEEVAANLGLAALAKIVDRHMRQDHTVNYSQERKT